MGRDSNVCNLMSRVFPERGAELLSAWVSAVIGNNCRRVSRLPTHVAALHGGARCSGEFQLGVDEALKGMTDLTTPAVPGETYPRIHDRLLVIEQIMNAIFQGALPIGERVSERQIAALIGRDTRTPIIREAVAVLVREGIITSRPQSGHRVEPVSVNDAVSLLRLRGGRGSRFGELQYKQWHGPAECAALGDAGYRDVRSTRR